MKTKLLIPLLAIALPILEGCRPADQKDESTSVSPSSSSPATQHPSTDAGGTNQAPPPSTNSPVSPK